MSGLPSRFGLNAQQSAFVKAYVRLGRAGPAAIEAGYAHETYGYRQIELPHVIAAVHAEVQRQLVVDAPMSYRVLQDLRDDKSTPARIRADIGIQLLKLAGHVVPASKDGAPQKQLSEMTREEMVAYIDRNQAEIEKAEAELAARATPVNAQRIDQDTPLLDAKPLTFLD